MALSALVGALGCGGTSPGKAATPTTQVASTSVPARTTQTAATPATVARAAVPSDCSPLKPPPSRELPEELKKALPRDDQGRPVITGQGGLALVYDSKIDDPIARWGACLSRVLAVKEANREPGRFAHCIDLIEACPTDEGGDACCPQACIDKFKQQLAGGLTEKEASAKSFTEGSCLKGFPARPAK